MKKSTSGLGMQIITSPFYYAHGDDVVTAQASLPSEAGVPVYDATPGDLLLKAVETAAEKTGGLLTSKFWLDNSRASTAVKVGAVLFIWWLIVRK